MPAKGSPWRPTIPPIDKRSAKSFIRTNERIRAREVRVIDENGEQLGIMAPFEALKMARERSLDLVEISPNAVQPVRRIQDYGYSFLDVEPAPAWLAPSAQVEAGVSIGVAVAAMARPTPARNTLRRVRAVGGFIMSISMLTALRASSEAASSA